jgi:hypothetical protein
MKSKPEKKGRWCGALWPPRMGFGSCIFSRKSLFRGASEAKNDTRSQSIAKAKMLPTGWIEQPTLSFAST